MSTYKTGGGSSDPHRRPEPDLDSQPLGSTQPRVQTTPAPRGPSHSLLIRNVAELALITIAAIFGVLARLGLEGVAHC